MENWRENDSKLTDNEGWFSNQSFWEEQFKMASMQMCTGEGQQQQKIDIFGTFYIKIISLEFSSFRLFLLFHDGLAHTTPHTHWHTVLFLFRLNDFASSQQFQKKNKQMMFFWKMKRWGWGGTWKREVKKKKRKKGGTCSAFESWITTAPRLGRAARCGGWSSLLFSSL